MGGQCSSRARDSASVRSDLQVVPVVRTRSADGSMSALPSWALASGQRPCPRGHSFCPLGTSAANHRWRPDPRSRLKGRSSALGTRPRAGCLGATTAVPGWYRRALGHQRAESWQPVDCSRFRLGTAGRRSTVIPEACRSHTVVFSTRPPTALKWLQVDRGILPILSGKAKG